MNDSKLSSRAAARLPPLTKTMDTQSVASASTATTTTRGLRLHLKKQLAEDIESGGGIQNFAGKDNQNLYHLLNKKVLDSKDPDHPYGQRGDYIRTQIRKLVQRWIEKDNKGKYVSEILNPWQIVQHSARMKQSAKKQTTQRKSSSDSSSSDSDSESSDSVSATVARNPRPTSFRRTKSRAPRTPPKHVVIDSSSKQPSTPLTPLVSLTARMSISENKLKRKIGIFDLDSVASHACKCRIGCLDSELPITLLTYNPFQAKSLSIMRPSIKSQVFTSGGTPNSLESTASR